jgi:hypothetical protein
MSNINCTQIPRLVDEEVYDIQGLEDGDEHQRRLDVPLRLVLIREVGKITVSRKERPACQCCVRVSSWS